MESASSPQGYILKPPASALNEQIHNSIPKPDFPLVGSGRIITSAEMSCSKKSLNQGITPLDEVTSSGGSEALRTGCSIFKGGHVYGALHHSRQRGYSFNEDSLSGVEMRHHQGQLCLHTDYSLLQIQGSQVEFRQSCLRSTVQN